MRPLHLLVAVLGLFALGACSTDAAMLTGPGSSGGVAALQDGGDPSSNN